MTTQSAPGAGTQGIVLVCVSGPDNGKRCTVLGEPITVGRDVTCNVLSDDADVAKQHGSFVLEPQGGGGGKSRVRFRSPGGPAFVDGHAASEGILLPGQQLRLGRSLWQLAPEGIHASVVSPSGWVDQLNTRISQAAGVEKIQGFSLGAMFSEVFKKRTPEEVESYFIAGTASTTPALSQVDVSWPRPWAFFKTALLSILIYIGFVVALEQFSNVNLIPGLMMVGSFAIPGSLLIFFFEMNVLRNVSLYQIIRLLLMGGILSLAAALLLYQHTDFLGQTLGDMSAGIVEETAKAACLLLVINRLNYRWILNGMLFGATIGTGFAAFESAGYAFKAVQSVQSVGMDPNYNPVVQLTTDGINAMIHNINVRGALSLCGGHTLWTALVGAALWKVRGNRKFEWAMVKDMRFLRVLALSMVLHMTWDSSIPETFYVKYIVIGLVGWFAAVAYIQEGLKEVRMAQAELGMPGVAGVVSSVPAAGSAVVSAAGVGVVVQSPVVVESGGGAGVVEGDGVGGA